MKTIHILILLITSAMNILAQQPPAAANQFAFWDRPVTRKSEWCCIGCAYLSALFCYSALLTASNNIDGKINRLRLHQEMHEYNHHHFDDYQKEAYQKGVIAGQTMCPKDTPVMHRDNNKIGLDPKILHANQTKKDN